MNYLIGAAFGWAVTYLLIKNWDTLVKKWADAHGEDTDKWDS